MTKAMRLKSGEQMARELAGATSLVLVDPHKMTSAQAVELRAEIRHAGGRIRVLKNAVASHALKSAGQDELAKQVAGMNALIWTQDPVPALKALFGYRAKNKLPQVRGGSRPRQPSRTGCCC
jgi:large subunit ribosomal protein L10